MPLRAEEIRVPLQTTQAIAPIYVSRARTADCTLSESYATQLERIFSRDLHFNGVTRVVSKNPQREARLPHFSAKACKSAGIPFVAMLNFEQQTIALKAFDARSGKTHSFSPIRLSGTLNHDRRIAHKLADGLHKALFQERGVASTKILFSWQQEDAHAEIWECDWDGANPRQVTYEHNYSITPVAIPSSSRFLFVSYKQGKPKIYIGSRKEAGAKPLISLRGNQLLPAIDKTRDKVAFISDADGRCDLFLLPLQSEQRTVGTPRQIFSFPRSVQASPSFSPDGTKIAFVSDKDGAPRIYVIAVPEGRMRPTARLVSKRNRESTCPSWSPDGKKLAYSAKTEGVRQIWIYDFETNEEWQLTSGPGNKENPSWAPNSKHLVYNLSDKEHADLYVVHLHQREVLKITHQPGKKHYPSWGD